jgi:hypothetical protein
VDGGLLVEPVGEVRGEHGARFDDEGRIEPDPLASLGAVDQHLRLPARRELDPLPPGDKPRRTRRSAEQAQQAVSTR